MADVLVAALTQRPLPHAIEHLYLTDPIADLGRIDGDHVLRRRRRIRLRPRRRATSATWAAGSARRSAARVDAGALPWPLLPAGECIRATALGASEYSVQLSGNTSYISKPGALLPRRNLQVLQPPFHLRGDDRPGRSWRTRSAPISPRSISSKARARWRWRCAGTARRPTSASPLSRDGIRHGLATTIERKKPLYIMLDGDVAQTLGRDPARGAPGRERDPGDRRRGAARLRLHRSRPHPHAVLHRAGDDQVAGVQRGPAPRPPAPAHPPPRARARSRPRSRHGHHHDHGHHHHDQSRR